MERTEPNSPSSQGYITPTVARSSVAQDMSRERNAPTPGVDDTPYIRFALDQLTRDQEVRGSGSYHGLGSGVEGNYPYVVPGTPGVHGSPTVGAHPTPQAFQQPREYGLQPEQYAETTPADYGEPSRYRAPQYDEYEALAIAPIAAAAASPYEFAKPEQKAMFGEPPPRNPLRISESRSLPRGLREQPSQHQQGIRTPDIFTAVPNEGGYLTRLSFIPGTLRPLQLGLFALLVLAYIICLVFCAAWSLANNGLWDYGVIGDGRYFVFQYLPTLLGIILFLWVVQIEVAVMRVAPFVAMASEKPKSREHGAQLPIYPTGFVLPYFGHFTAGLPLAGFFMVVAWLQLWTIPLLASSFNVYFYGPPDTGRFRWIATQGAIWVVIALYLLLLLAIILLMVWLKFGRALTGLKWDPRSLADLIVLMSRSNALDMTAEWEPALLGYWRTNHRPNETFHTYGINDKAARRYSLEAGRIQEKSTSPIAPPMSRFSREPDDLEGDEERHSKESMLPRPASTDSSSGKGDSALPWFLHVSAAALWAIIAFVLLLAFLIVSYLPSTMVSTAFSPTVPAPVNTDGFSSTNFLYSFVPALLGTLCLLFWLDIDYAHRRLQAFAALGKEDGELAEMSLLLSYVANLPGFVTISALIDGHWRIALLTFVTLIATTLPILSGGVFWAQFYVSDQNTRIAAHMPAYYALTVFAVLYALAYFLIFPSRQLRQVAHSMGGNAGMSFADIIDLVHQSKMLSDVAFHAPEGKVQLVTRLLSVPPGTRLEQRQEEGAQSKVSLADSIRGYGRARQDAYGGHEVPEVPRYYLGQYSGRDGRSYVGIDRTRT